MTTLELVRPKTDTLLAEASSVHADVVHVKVAGYHQISKTAVRRIALAVAAETAGVALNSIKADVKEVAGKVDVRLNIPLELSSLLADFTAGASTVLDRAANIRQRVTDQVLALASTEIGILDVRVSALRGTPTELATTE